MKRLTIKSFGVCRQLEDGKIYRFAERQGFITIWSN